MDICINTIHYLLAYVFGVFGMQLQGREANAFECA